ncbi:MAG: RNA polymerase sigma factor [Candidatus Brocadiia bacterium]
MSHADPRDDAALVQAINRGEPAAFETLYRRYRDWVLALAHRFTRDPNDALDVLQETFAYLLDKAPELRLSAKMTTFLYPVVKNLALGTIRKRDRHQSEADATWLPAPPREPGPEEARAQLAHVLAALPQGHREVVLLRFVDDMALREIAEALDIPLGTVKSRLHSALQRLRDDPRTRRYFLGEEAQRPDDEGEEH